MTTTILGWHFTAGRKLARDGRAIRVGRVLVHRGPVIPCKSGLHLSERLIDALTYTPGALCWRVEGSGEIVPHGDPGDKHACSRRKALWMVDAEPVLRRFARWCALRAAHLWSPPEIVMRYLVSGDAGIRDAARDAVRGAAWDVARVDARDAAWDAARVAARDAAWDAARGAARDAAWAAAWACSSRWDAAWAAARAAQNARLTDWIGRVHGGEVLPHEISEDEWK